MDDDDRNTRNGSGNSGHQGNTGGDARQWGDRPGSAYGRPRLPRKPHASDAQAGVRSNRRFGNMREADRPAVRSTRRLDTHFEPTISAAEHRLDRVRPTAYAKTRNFIDGAVTLLSPYITHGFLNIPACIEKLSLQHMLTLEDKLIYEFAWREYFHHVWSRLGDGILSDIRNPVWRGRYETSLPDDITHGATGVAVIDAAVRMLYAEGYLHNHMRMWLASYVVHIRKVDWKVGAAWMYTHLLDGDLASNWLSWQWVAGTFAHKPYLFNADNVSRYFAGMNCSGTKIDTSYVDLEAIARGRNSLGPEPGHHPRIDPPTAPDSDLTTLLSRHGLRVLNDDALLSRLDTSDIELRHPWCLGPVRPDTTPVIAWIDMDFHDRFAWSAKRWEFVLRRLGEMTTEVWLTRTSAFVKAVRHSKHGLQAMETWNPGYAALKDCDCATLQAAPRFFANPLQLQPSFTRFFDHAMAGRELTLSPQTTSRQSA